MPERPSNDDGQKRSRLDREVDEILERSGDPVSFEDHVRKRVARERRERISKTGQGAIDSLAGFGPGAMLIGAFLVGVCALWVSSFSGILANILVSISVGLLLGPIVMSVRSHDRGTTKRWRGQDIDLNRPTPPWVNTVRERFKRPPRF